MASFAGPIFRTARLDKGGVSSSLLAALTVGVVQVVFISLSSTGINNSSIQNCVSVPLQPSSFARHLSPFPLASVCLFFAAFALFLGGL